MSSFQSQNNDIKSVDNNYRSSLNSAPVEKNRNFFNNDNLPPELFDNFESNLTGYKKIKFIYIL